MCGGLYLFSCVECFAQELADGFGDALFVLCTDGADFCDDFVTESESCDDGAVR